MYKIILGDDQAKAVDILVEDLTVFSTFNKIHLPYLLM